MPQFYAKVIHCDGNQAQIELLDDIVKCNNCHSGCAKSKLHWQKTKTLMITAENQKFSENQLIQIDISNNIFGYIMLLKTIVPFLLFIVSLLGLYQISELLAFSVAILSGLLSLFGISKLAGKQLERYMVIDKVSIKPQFKN